MTTPAARLRPAGVMAWAIAAITLGALVSSAAFRSSTGVLMVPIAEDLGWPLAAVSGAVSLNLVLFGLVAPFAAAFMDAWGVRRVCSVALVVIAVASILTCVITRPWQLWVLWGLMIGPASGAMALVLGAIVAGRWFVRHRGLVMGIFSAANATGQLLFLPLIAHTAMHEGWRAAAAIISVLSLLMAVLMAVGMRERPGDVGRLPSGARGLEDVADADHATDPTAPTGLVAGRRAARRALTVLRRISTRWTFWALALAFAVCGWTTNGLVQTHFISASHDHGMPATTAAGLLAVVGIFDIVGTVASGWLTDRVDSRYLLVAYYALRGVSLLLVHSVMAATVQAPMWAFIVFYGLDWVATVPPTVALSRQHFGAQDAGIAFGWMYAAHMVGAGIGASVAGAIREASGSYLGAWMTAAGLCFAAAALVLTVRRAGPVAS